MTGDVLSPRWSTDDTDEQPAIQVVGNETYILPPGRGALTGEPQLIGETPRDVLDDPAPPRDVLSGGSAFDVSGQSDLLTGAREAVSASYGLTGENGPHDVPSGASYDDLGGPQETRTSSLYDELRDPDDVRAASPYDELRDPDDARAGSPYDELAGHSGPHRVAEDDDDNPYLPLDRSHSSGPDDDLEEDRPKRGFLGSGWTDDSGSSGSYDGRSSGGEGEVRRRTRVLLVAAVAVVLVGVGAGWMLTGTSSDDPCAGVQCASAGEVTSPSESAAPEDTPVEEATEETPDPADSATAEPSEPQSTNPPATQTRARPTREAEPSATPTRDRTTAEPTRKPTREPQGTMNDTAGTQGSDDGDGGGGSSSSSSNKQDNKGDSSGTGGSGGSGSTSTQPPATTQAPAPTPTQEERKGLLDILFPWA
ncbi:hypothetical protein BKM31_01065 [[Actinomadura] parvosata subsp. kistnae]|uniref:Uncharacterized protein n=1 Tax=[Actinomadura] parvosata subsp. kistnae TaxID=1909395 RepID=A0A1U9ZQS6_9ACTN|nr:hypothetical protein BKM31_01065 [Nonomuraea sp. ATCC 55076]